MENLTVRNASGSPLEITDLPRSGANPHLQLVGASYGVIKLATDPPHWSSDGHCAVYETNSCHAIFGLDGAAFINHSRVP